ncbi:MAG: DUF4233 domain-containing protein [Marmoricola sp.]
MQRRLCSAILLLEAVVLGLSTPVMISVESVDKAHALWTGLGLTVACLLVAGALRKPWAYGVGWAIQVAAVALGVLVTAMYVLGAIFLLLWLAAVRIGRLIDTDRAAAEGTANAD